jgi:Zn-dependent peptidase ImmA (M78 family)
LQSSIRWTNKSVGKLAGDADPIDVIVRMARDAVLVAMDKGWSGPPFSQLKLANLLDLRVEANSSVADAQTIAENEHLVIRYNPTQVRERVRFSIAHEIAHTFFPEKLRNFM